MNTTAEVPASGWVYCDSCGDLHPAHYSHEGRFSEGSLFAVVCPADDLTDWYTAERFVPAPTKSAPVALDLDLS